MHKMLKPIWIYIYDMILMLRMVVTLSSTYILDVKTNHYCIIGRAIILLGLYYYTWTNNLSILINEP